LAAAVAAFVAAAVDQACNKDEDAERVQLGVVMLGASLYSADHLQHKMQGNGQINALPHAWQHFSVTSTSAAEPKFMYVCKLYTQDLRVVVLVVVMGVLESFLKNYWIS
jgi:hypothetical protein